METLGIYVQVPFCASKCSYCNFSSGVARSAAFDSYTHALAQESDRLASFYEALGISACTLDLPVDTVYVGGGTPSILGAERLARINSLLRRRFCFQIPPEFTLEITPGSADDAYLKKARALGVNRLSIGAQTFDDGELRAVGRLHSAQETRDLVQRARRAGFTNLSLDMVAGLPHQTEASWLRSLQEAARLRPEHFSVYLFEIDEKSRLGKEVLHGGNRYHAGTVPDDDFMADAYEQAQAFLAREGYFHYEISNFALPGFESRHNQKYWQLQPYAGLGAGAHSFDGAHRWANVTAAEAYVAKLARGESPIAEHRQLSCEEQLEEFFFLGLRQTEGVNLAPARHRWGDDLVNRWQERISASVREGLLEKVHDQVRLTERAYLISNEVFQEFVTL